MSEQQRNLLILAAVAILVGLSIYVIYPLQKTTRLGLDLQGGLDVILKAVAKPGAPVTQSALDQALLIIDKRVNGLGVTEPVIQRQGTREISIQLPGIKNANEAIRLINKPAFLEFREVLTGKEKPEITLTAPDGSKLKMGPILMTGKAISSAQVSFDQQTGAPEVSITFTPDGTREFAAITTRLVKKQLAIILDNKVQSAPVIQTPITDGKAVISGRFSLEEAKNLALVLQTGALPVNLVIQETRTVGPTLGKDSLNKALLAGLIGLMLVALGMLIYYRGLGFVAVIALAVYAVLLWGVLTAVKATLTLPGIAGIILTIGVAVDANIIIYERIKEEIRMGKTARASLKSGFQHSLSPILDANFLTIVTAAILFWLGSGPVRGFAFNLLIGVLVSLLTALFFTRALISILINFSFFNNPIVLGTKAADAE